MRPIVFELHLTTTPIASDQLFAFTSLCQSVGGRAVLIDLPVGQHTQQPMLSMVSFVDEFDEILTLMDTLNTTFEQAGYPIVRRKVEIPAHKVGEFFERHPTHNHHGYFEWHGKVHFQDNAGLQELRNTATNHHAHVSKNALKDDKYHRFITIRHSDSYEHFFGRIGELVSDLLGSRSSGQLSLTKTQAEYCIYDDHLALDDGWSHPTSHPPVIPLYEAWHSVADYQGHDYDHHIKELIAQEAFLRRASMVADSAFVLKGSHVTRQYFDNTQERLPADLDFVCLTPLPDQETAQTVLSAWAEKVTSTLANDGVMFEKFSEDAFWRCIDYAMNDDFPTVSSNLTCYIDGKPHYSSIEVSFNLPMDNETVALPYDTPTGHFSYPYTVPLHYQLAWKLHQTLVRPRFKDIYDLTYLVNSATPAHIKRSLQELVDECYRDKIDKEQVLALFDYDINQTFGVGENLFDKILGKQLANQALRFTYQKEYHTLKAFCPKLPKDVATLWTNFTHAMQEKGFDKNNPDFYLPTVSSYLTESKATH